MKMLILFLLIGNIYADNNRSIKEKVNEDFVQLNNYHTDNVGEALLILGISAILHPKEAVNYFKEEKKELPTEFEYLDEFSK